MTEKEMADIREIFESFLRRFKDNKFLNPSSVYKAFRDEAVFTVVVDNQE